MISEPELVGDVTFPEPRTASAVPDTLDSVTPPAPRPRRPWLWAVGGAAVASALWAGGLYAYESRGVDLGGYRSTRNLCLETDLKAVSTALGKKVTATSPETEEHPALDRATCSLKLGPENNYFEVLVSYQLHKVTDPGPEFEAVLEQFPGDEAGERVEGLGEAAFKTPYDAESGRSAEVDVLDGQAVFSLYIVAVQMEEGGEGKPPAEPTEDVDLSGIEEFLMEDARALMAKLKK
ncbi:hypothetical protein [Streptomyces purpureus]|uniref:hypothetical protein n=1 Tax=Streptomyces purpureus TaxID=1951 RepID=UPI00036D466B|nr:hypothetical protein [Streptomyces purpureus]